MRVPEDKGKWLAKMTCLGEIAVPALSLPAREFHGETHEKSKPLAQKLVLGMTHSGKARASPRGATHAGYPSNLHSCAAINIAAINIVDIIAHSVQPGFVRTVI